MSVITIEQQIAELRAELAHCDLTKHERREAVAELEWLKEQLRIDEEATYFAAIDREAEAMPGAGRFSINQLPF
jgi:prefoldin subunit 5